MMMMFMEGDEGGDEEGCKKQEHLLNLILTSVLLKASFLLRLKKKEWKKMSHSHSQGALGQHKEKKMNSS